MQRVATRLGRRLIGVPEASSAPISDKLIITEICAACYRERLESGRAAAYPVVRSFGERERGGVCRSTPGSSPPFIHT